MSAAKREPADMLREVKRHLLSGPASQTWKRGARSYTDGPACLVETLSWKGFYALEPLLSAEATRLGYQGDGFDCAAAVFNDTNPTRLWGVLALINRAIRSLEAR